MHSSSPCAQVLVGLTGLVLGVACQGGSAASSPKPDVAVARDGSKDGGPSDAALDADDGSALDAAAGPAPGLLRMVGAVDDSDILLGAVVDGRRARLFFCGGESSYTTATRWVVVDLDADGGFDFDEMDLRATGRLRSESLRGQWSAGDETHDFTAQPIRADTIAGLYEGTAECGRIGLIVTQGAAGDEASAQGACVGPGHLPKQVHPILPVALERGEIRVAIGGDESRVRPAAAAM